MAPVLPQDHSFHMTEVRGKRTLKRLPMTKRHELYSKKFEKWIQSIDMASSDMLTRPTERQPLKTIDNNRPATTARPQKRQSDTVTLGSPSKRGRRGSRKNSTPRLEALSASDLPTDVRMHICSKLPLALAFQVTKKSREQVIDRLAQDIAEKGSGHLQSNECWSTVASVGGVRAMKMLLTKHSAIRGQLLQCATNTKLYADASLSKRAAYIETKLQPLVHDGVLTYSNLRAAQRIQMTWEDVDQALGAGAFEPFDSLLLGDLLRPKDAELAMGDTHGLCRSAILREATARGLGAIVRQMLVEPDRSRHLFCRMPWRPPQQLLRDLLRISVQHGNTYLSTLFVNSTTPSRAALQKALETKHYAIAAVMLAKTPSLASSQPQPPNLGRVATVLTELAKV